MEGEKNREEVANVTLPLFVFCIPPVCSKVIERKRCGGLIETEKIKTDNIFRWTVCVYK